MVGVFFGVADISTEQPYRTGIVCRNGVRKSVVPMESGLLFDVISGVATREGLSIGRSGIRRKVCICKILVCFPRYRYTPAELVICCWATRWGKQLAGSLK